MGEKNTFTLKETAQKLNVTERTVREGIISGSLPIGAAVKCEREYSYIIPQGRLEAWMSGDDLKNIIRDLKSILQLLKQINLIDMVN